MASRIYRLAHHTPWFTAQIWAISTLRVGNNQGILDVVPGATPHWRQAGACEK
jgi:hypothetical protein